MQTRPCAMLVSGVRPIDALPILALRTVSSTHPVRHVTMNILCGNGFFATTSYVQL